MKILKRFIVILLLISITFGTFKYYNVFAEEKKANDSIIDVDSNVTIDSDIKMTININNITYDNFIFKLTSNDTIENITTDTNNLELINDNNEITFNINKEETNLSTISLNYKLSENISVGDKISFKIQILNADNEEEIININKIVNVIEQVEEKENKTEEKKDDNKTKVEEKSNTNMNSKSTNLQQSSSKSNIQSNMLSTSKSNNVQTVKVTYNGSDNNYLSKLIVNNYSLNKDFAKESSNYFVTVDNNVTKVSVKATAEDSNSSISINGNDNLEVGVNKILITVTAENGNTRNYRIYVTRKSE